jgi:alpha-galactosidase
MIGSPLSVLLSPDHPVNMQPTHRILTTVLFTALLASVAGAKPLKVFILAGQSNMEGPANIGTFDYIGDDPATAPLLEMMRGADGEPTVSEGMLGICFFT